MSYELNKIVSKNHSSVELKMIIDDIIMDGHWSTVRPDFKKWYINSGFGLTLIKSKVNGATRNNKTREA